MRPQVSRTRRWAPTVGIPSICCPDISGQGAAAGRGRDRLPRCEPDVAPGLYPVVELHLRAQAAGKYCRVDWIRRVGVPQWLRVPRHQRVADPRLGRRRAAALRRSSGGTATTSGTAARTASTTRCRPPSIGDSAAAFSSRVLHLVESHQPGRLLRLDRVYLERGKRVRPQPRAGGLRYPHNFQLGFVYQLPFGNGKKSGRVASAAPSWGLADERSLRRLSGDDRSRYSSRLLTEHAGQHTDGRPGQGQVQILGNVGDDGTVSTRAPSRASRRPVRQRGPEHHARTRRGQPGHGSVPHLRAHTPFDMQFRAEAFNVFNTPHFAHPNKDVNSSNFGRILEHRGMMPWGRPGSSASACV